jgi:hypothetical protein
VTTAFVSGRDVNTADDTAENAVENNFLEHLETPEQKAEEVEEFVRRLRAFIEQNGEDALVIVDRTAEGAGIALRAGFYLRCIAQGVAIGAEGGLRGAAIGAVGGALAAYASEEAIGTGIEFAVEKSAEIIQPENPESYYENVNRALNYSNLLGLKGLGKVKTSVKKIDLDPKTVTNTPNIQLVSSTTVGNELKAVTGNIENISSSEARIGLKGRDYIRDMEGRSGISIQPEQRSLLVSTLQENEFRVLDREAKSLHSREYRMAKSNLISEWEQNTGNVWPIRERMNLNTGKKELVPDQIHHIIPQQVGGPHEWWNMHPLEAGRHHQGGVHGKDSVLRKITKENE